MSRQTLLHPYGVVRVAEAPYGNFQNLCVAIRMTYHAKLTPMVRFQTAPTAPGVQHWTKSRKLNSPRIPLNLG